MRPINRNLLVNNLQSEFVPGKECDRVFGTTPEIRKNLRVNGEWFDPVHLKWLNSRYCVYRLDMVRSWIENRHQPHIHLAESEQLLAKLSKFRYIA